MNGKLLQFYYTEIFEVDTAYIIINFWNQPKGPSEPYDIGKCGSEVLIRFDLVLSF
jgi:hypothetical protein